MYAVQIIDHTVSTQPHTIEIACVYSSITAGKIARNFNLYNNNPSVGPAVVYETGDGTWFVYSNERPQ